MVRQLQQKPLPQLKKMICTCVLMRGQLFQWTSFQQQSSQWIDLQKRLSQWSNHSLPKSQMLTQARVRLLNSVRRSRSISVCCQGMQSRFAQLRPRRRRKGDGITRTLSQIWTSGAWMAVNRPMMEYPQVHSSIPFIFPILLVSN